ncbi:MAG: iron-sulfur cluster assembly scaffold protein, partial [Firmicutes bacterium]|nr:iron-sulfur cluster assembly scaffold protein [Bacillota bacterium]
ELNKTIKIVTEKMDAYDSFGASGCISAFVDVLSNWYVRSTFGCGSAIASSSMATELIKGKPVEEAMQLTNKAVAEALDGLPDYKMHCSVLAEEAIQSALENYYKNDPEEKE